MIHVLVNVFKFIETVILAIFILYIIREIISYINLDHYKKQAIKTFYLPFLGCTKYFIKSKDSNDSLQKQRTFLDSKMSVNNMNGVSPQGFLLDDDLI